MNDDLLKKVHALAQLDRDAVGVYDDVIKQVEDADVKEHFTDFRDEHQHHITALSEALVRLGSAPASTGLDAMGVVADWIMSFRAMLGEKGPLHAMHTAEKYHVSRYKDAAEWDLGDAALAANIKTFYAEELRHLVFMDERLAKKA